MRYPRDITSQSCRSAALSKPQIASKVATMSTDAKVPTLLWADRERCIYVTIDVQDAKGARCGRGRWRGRRGWREAADRAAAARFPEGALRRSAPAARGPPRL